MAQSAIQQLRERLREIIGFLEKGDSKSAAAVVVEMKEALPTSPLSVPSENEVEEVRSLLERYAVLGAELRERTIVAMNRLGGARRSRVYRRQGPRP